MRRTRPALAETPESTGYSAVDGIALDREAEGVASDVIDDTEPAADEYMPEHRRDDESAWSPCSSPIRHVPSRQSRLVMMLTRMFIRLAR